MTRAAAASVVVVAAVVVVVVVVVDMICYENKKKTRLKRIRGVFMLSLKSSYICVPILFGPQRRVFMLWTNGKCQLLLNFGKIGRFFI
jgi:hypothetical protein